MSVFRRKTSKGLTDSFHYRFFHAGKIYSGVCAECRTKAEALNCEKAEREKITTGTAAIRRKRLTRKKAEKIVNSVIDTDTATGISLEDAFAESLKKPKKRKATGDFLQAKKSYWRDFVAFMKDKFPGAQTLKDVERKHAEDYLSYIREHGRFQKKIEWKGGKAFTRKGNYSHKTCNVIHDTLKEVFKLLMDDAGLSENPFAGIEKLDNESATREPFTEDELKKIFTKADEFIYPVFAIGISTALREGDICTLRWDEVDFKNNFIRRRTSKTGKIVEIPMMPPLVAYLSELKAKAPGKAVYVLPGHDKIYNKNPDGISRRVKEFLESLDIQTTRKIEGRDRLVSVKDVHSLRHSFCYLAGIYGIPLLVVQSICGHMTPEMTSLYQRHADLKTKQAALAKLPSFLMPSASKEGHAALSPREELKQIAQSASDADIEKILPYVKKNICQGKDRKRLVVIETVPGVRGR